MHVTRSQFPVGQGCFHAGRIDWRNATNGDLEKFHYIYDCGSNDVSALSDAIATYRTQVSRVDALFISHLHEDHVNGIDRLLSAVEVDTVYLPYIDNVFTAISLIEADVVGALSVSLIQASIDPQSWFGRRGVSRIVRVLPFSGYDFEVAGVVAEDHRRSDDPELQDKEDILVSEAISPKQLGAKSSVEVINSGTNVNIVRSGVNLDWVFVPHVDPVPVRRYQSFRNALRSAFGLAPRERLTAFRLADAMRTRSRRIKIRNCYEKIFQGGSSYNHNRVSMSLYSGPIDVAGGERSRRYRVFRRTAKWSDHTEIHTSRWSWWFEEQAAGWVGSGDATLGNKDVRAAWRMTLNRFQEEIGTLLLPHHGSSRNFHRELLDFPNLELCVVSAGDPSPYDHPSHAVIQEVVKSGKKLYRVSADPLTGLYEEIRAM